MSTRICLSLILCLAVTSVAIGQLPPKAELAGKAADFSQARSLPYQLSGRTIFENVIIDNQHFAMVVDWKKGKLEPVALYPLTTVEIPTYNENWVGIPKVVTDPLGDASPAGEGLPPLPGTDFTALYMASDGTYMYFKLDLDAYPAAGCSYTVSFEQYLNQTNTPGDLGAETIFQDGVWITMVWGHSGIESANVYGKWDDQDVKAGANYLQFRVPIEKLRYANNTPYPFSPSYSRGPQGIENRFITVTIWGEPNSEAPGMRDNGPQPPYRPMIINFWPPQSTP